mgnify:CR=1 FL=1
MPEPEYYWHLARETCHHQSALKEQQDNFKLWRATGYSASHLLNFWTVYSILNCTCSGSRRCFPPADATLVVIFKI